MDASSFGLDDFQSVTRTQPDMMLSAILRRRGDTCARRRGLLATRARGYAFLRAPLCPDRTKLKARSD